MIEHPSKLPNVGTTIFTVMSQLAAQHEAVNLSQGFPNFDTDPKLLELVSNAMNQGLNQYAPMQGIYSLRETIATKIDSLYGHAYHPESEITITAGATQAIYTAISAFVRPDDEVILFKPAYDCYEPAIAIHGGKVVPIQLSKNFQINWNAVIGKISAATKMIIINSPHNPSGSLLSKEDLFQLEKVLQGTNIIVLSDEVYEHIVFDGEAHESVAKYPNLVSRSLICASFGKTFHVTGWKLGYIAGPKNLMEEFQRVHQFNVFCVNHPIQQGIATYLKDENHYRSLGMFYQEKRDYFLKGIETSRFQFTPSSGTYFQILEYHDISEENDMAFAKRLVEQYKIASIPISVFNLDNKDRKQLRFCFAKTDTTLNQAIEILNRI